MRRFDKKKHIQELNKKLSNHTVTRIIETFPETLQDDEVSESTTKDVNLLNEGTTTMFDKLCGVKLIAEEVEPLNELSSDMVMGAAKKMWQDKIGGDGHLGNPRAKKLLDEFGSKLKGMKLFGGVVDHVAAELKYTNTTFQLIIYIGTRDGLIGKTHKEIGYTGVFYNFSTDQYMIGSSISDLRPLVDYQYIELDKYDARQLSKIAEHFNPKTRYKNFTRELRIKVEETVEGGISEAPVSNTNQDTYFETLSETLDAVRRKAESVGCTLDEDEVHFQFGTGGISYGTTKSATINLLKDGQPILSKSGKPLNRALRVVIYRMDSGRYELTCYKTW